MTCSSIKFIDTCETALYPKLHLLGIELWLTATLPDVVNIEALWSHQARNEGHGRKAMQLLCALADSHGISLTATVHPLAYGELEDEPEDTAHLCEVLDQKALDAAALEAWYIRLGFARLPNTDAWNPTMRRPAQH